MEYVFNKEEERKEVEKHFSKMGLEAKVTIPFKIDFKKISINVRTGKTYPYFNEERKTEKAERVFYTGKKSEINDINTLLLIGKYYESGMMHDLILFHRGRKFLTLKSSYLYEEELKKNSESQSKEGKDIIPNPSWFTRLSLEEYDSFLVLPSIFGYEIDKNETIKKYIIQISRYSLFIKKNSLEVSITPSINFDKTTKMFKEVIAEHLLYPFAQTYLNKEIENQAKQIWTDLIT